MAIKYRAIHDQVSWKKVGNHSSLHNAISGEKGAKEILKGKSEYVKKLWEDRGKPLYIFVWDDGDSKGYAFRDNPITVDFDIQIVKVPVSRLEVLDNSGGCSSSVANNIFDTYAPVKPITENIYPDELPEGGYFEGAASNIVVNNYERSLEARKQCIEHFGAICSACEMDFETVYGEIGRGFIHVHHKVKISRIKQEYVIDPLNDLVPVCPNCHAMVHRTEPPLSIERLRKILKKDD